MGRCIYRFTASESYQRTPPGCGVETHCGAETYPIYDQPEIVLARVLQEDGSTALEHVATGVLLPRTEDDPHCPEHGGTPKPEPGLIKMFLQREMAQKRAELQALQSQLESADPAVVLVSQAALTAGSQQDKVPAVVFDPAEHTVSEVLDHLEHADPAEVHRVIGIELVGKNRKGITEHGQ